MSIIKLIIAFFLSLSQFFAPYFAMLSEGNIDKFIEKHYENWSVEDEYTADYAINLEKDPDKDFVVLNLADVQLNDSEAYGSSGYIAEETISKLIKAVNPDLITLSGDNAWGGQMSYIRVVEVIDSYGIPWAPVMGNHDGDNGEKISENWCAYQLYKAKNSLFKFGPKDMGIGNYVINITENGNIIHTIYMMDTHTNTDKDCGGYDHLWDNQLDWYKWAVEGTNAIAGKTVESSIIFHIPCYEYRTAWSEVYVREDGVKYYEEGKGEFTAAYEAYESFGTNGENVCSPEFNSGFFTLVKDLGSTKNIVAGHDHVNDASILYDGIRLSYSLKCGPGCYWDAEKNGGSTLTINSDGQASFAHHYIDPAQFADGPVC